jgi:hypothetical protein
MAPGYQVPLAAAVKTASGIAVKAVGMIVSTHQAEAIIAGGQADFVALAGGFLDDLPWGWHAAAALGADAVYPPQYRRARPEHWPGAALARAQPRGENSKGSLEKWLRASDDRRSPSSWGSPPLDPNVRDVERARRRLGPRDAFEADEFERVDADRRLQVGRQKIGLHRRTRHIAATRAGDDERRIEQQPDFVFGRRLKGAADANDAEIDQGIGQTALFQVARQRVGLEFSRHRSFPMPTSVASGRDRPRPAAIACPESARCAKTWRLRGPYQPTALEGLLPSFVVTTLRLVDRSQLAAPADARADRPPQALCTFPICRSRSQ